MKCGASTEIHYHHLIPEWIFVVLNLKTVLKVSLFARNHKIPPSNTLSLLELYFNVLATHEKLNCFLNFVSRQFLHRERERIQNF